MIAPASPWRHAVWSLGILASGLQGCHSDPPVADSAAAVSASPRDGWVEWLATDASALATVQKHAGWRSFYNRRYREAAAAFSAGTSPGDRVGLARSHIALSRLAVELARLLARARGQYFDERARLGTGVPSLPRGAYHRAVAMLFEKAPGAGAALAEVQGSAGEASAHTRLARDLAVPCGQVPPGGDAWAVVAGSLRCAIEGSSTPDCPKGEVGRPVGLDEAWSHRVMLYYGAVCGDPAAVDESALLSAASAPVDEDVTAETKAGGVDIRATVEHHDLVALWALARFHARRAESILGGGSAMERGLLASIDRLAAGRVPSGGGAPIGEEPVLEYLLFSAWRDAAALDDRPGAGAPAEPEQTLETAARETKSLIQRLEGSPNAEARRAVKDLGLESAHGDAMIRAAASQAMMRGDCGVALRLLRATSDAKAQETTYRNEPRFRAELAASAVCMGRTTEALGELRSLKMSYAEAAGPLSVVGALAVLRSMGGNGGRPISE